MALKFLNDGYFAGKVGIGTESPTAKLHVSTGSSGATVYSGYNDMVIEGGNGASLSFLTPDANPVDINFGTPSSQFAAGIRAGYNSGTEFIAFKVVDSEKMRIIDTGNVGIGTASPDQKLQVQGNIRIPNQGKIVFGSAGATPTDYLELHDVNASGSLLKLVQDTNTRFVVQGVTGNVGIGTASPTEPLTVSKTASGSTTQIASLVNPVGTANTGVRLWMSGTNTTTRGTFIDAVAESASNDHSLRFGTSASSSTPTERMRITSGGNVGIGTISPSGILHVKGSTDDTVVYIDTNNNALGDSAKISFNDRAQVGWIDAAVTLTDGGGNKDIKLKVATGSVFVQTNNTTRLTVADGGNVGIGTTSPTAAKLVVDSSTAPQILVKNSSGNNAQILFEDNSGGSQNASIKFDQASQNTLTIETGYNSPNNTNRIYLAPAGDVALTAMGGSGGSSATKVGIGTTTPTAKLHVAGTGLFTGLVSGITPVNAANFVTKAYVDGSGGGTGPFLPLAGGTMTGNVKFNDNVFVKFGNQPDFEIGHDASNSYITHSGVGNLIIQNTEDNADIIFKSDNGLGGVTEYFTVDGANEVISFQKHTKHEDNVTANFGNASDLQIYHSSSNNISFITNSNAAGLRLQSNELRIFANNGSTIRADFNTAIKLYYNDSKKFETTSAGVTVTGSGVFTGIASPRIKATGNTATGYPGFMLSNTGQEYEIIVGGNDSDKFKIRSVSPSAADLLNIESGGNATFAGNVTATNILTVAGAATGNPYLQFTQGGSQKAYIQYVDSGDSFELQSDNQFVVRTGGSTVALTINSSQNATFAGDITLGANYIGRDGDNYIGFQSDNLIKFRVNGATQVKLSDGVFAAQTDSDVDLGSSSTRFKELWVDSINGGSVVPGSYLPLAGGTMTGNTKHNDSVFSYWGNNDDLAIRHNGTDSWIENYTGDLQIVNYADDKDIKFWSDNGSGGVEEYFRVDGSARSIVVSAALGVYHNDGVAARFGNAGDLQIYHNATNSIISNATGNLYIKTTGADKDIIFEADDGSGSAVTEYFRLDGGSLTNQFLKTVKLYDAAQLWIGDGNDFQIYHNGNTFLDNYTGGLYIRQQVDNNDVYFQADRGDGNLANYFYLSGTNTDNTNTLGATIFPDKSKIFMGDSKDLQIYHDGSNSYIDETGAGGLVVKTGDFYLRNPSNAEMIRASSGASVELYEAGIKKFETTDTGVAVTGAATATTATTSTDNNATLTTKGYVDGLVTGVPVYKGTWDARNVAEGGATDGGNPDLRLNANKVLGNYYIVSTAGSATPNGSGTGPNSWNVGDWCIFSDVTPGTGTDLWQKIDNTSVISGAGTGQSVTKWDGTSGATSETLTDGPITFSSNDSTFAGDLYIPNKIIHVGDDDTWMQFEPNVISLRTGGTDRLTLTNSTATFTGDITSTGLTVDYTGNRTGDAGILVTNDSSDWGIKVDKDGTTDYGILSQTDGNNAIVVRNAAGTQKIQLQGDGGATFASNVTVGSGLGAVDTDGVLTINGGSGTNGEAYLNLSRGGTSGFILNHAAGNIQIRGTANIPMYFYTNGSIRQTIAADGNVGIGTTSPEAKLDVIGQGIFQGSTTSSYKGANVGTLNINNNSADGTVDFTQGLVFTDNVTNQGSWTHAGIVSVGSTGYNGSLVFGTDGDGVRNTSGITEKMRITSAGNVGIGTTSPTEKLVVDGKVIINNSAPPNNLAQLNIGYVTGETRAIDIDGGWSAGESKSITFTYGSAATDIVGQINCALINGDDSRLRWGKLYHSGNSSTYTMELKSTSLTTANLTVAGSIQMANDTATASAAKVGTMRYRTGTEYVEVTGIELVVNGDFATNTTWTKSGTVAIANGTANWTNAVNGAGFFQAITFTANAFYRCVVTVSNYSTGTFRFRYPGISSPRVSANGTYSFIIQADQSQNATLYLQGETGSDANVNFSIDNVSVVEVTAEDASYADMCMQTGSSTYEWVNIVRNTY